uniref:MYB family transcription factor n=1 Tax=Melilotus albus TaxID=47082 RepID=A0A896WAZ3_MELAB|nr:MYB family transcription factor [Melilotus albus]
MENHQNQNKNPNQELDLDRHQGWGTWEELLLASAVDRYGIKDWDTVAMEVQSRTNRSTLLATADHCEQKFHDLNRRFIDEATPPQQNGDVSAATGVDSDHVPWLEKLRKQRVAELRRDVQRSDASIMSLQLKLKRLEEEKAKENDGKEETEPDLAVSGKEQLPENEKTGRETEEPEPANSEPDIRRLDESTTNTDKLLPTTGEESDRDNQSVNESNSTGSRFDALKTGEVDAKLGSGPGPGSGSVQVKSGLNEPDQTGRKTKSVEEESNNGSYDNNNEAKAVTCESVPPSEDRKVEDDSVTLSEEGGTRESSEVQSSSSLSKTRRTRRRKEVSGEEVKTENEDVTVVKSEPLVSVLEMIKRHEKISLFERRLEKNQDLDRYKDTVKQHVDLETIQLRLQKGQYSSFTNAFFRDLILLFTNASVFFPRDSPESRVAQQLHRLINDEMKSFGQAQSDTITQKNDSLPLNTQLSKPDSLLSKHKAPPILVCRKRSSIPVKPSTSTFSQKGDHKPINNDKKEKLSSDVKLSLKQNSDTDEEEPPKAREKPVTGARSRRSNKNLSNNASNKKPPSSSTHKTGSSANKPVETPKLKNKAEGVSDKKKNGAAGFLNRMKRNESVEVLRSGSGGGGGGGSSGSSKGGGGGANTKEQKKIVNNGKGEKGKERASRYNEGGGSGDKRNKNIESNSKKSVGRPPKKAETNVVSAKRGRESSASGGKDKRPKKRSKK